jgi:hypothetical protein
MPGSELETFDARCQEGSEAKEANQETATSMADLERRAGESVSADRAPCRAYAHHSAAQSEAVKTR